MDEKVAIEHKKAKRHTQHDYAEYMRTLRLIKPWRLQATRQRVADVRYDVPAEYDMIVRCSGPRSVGDNLSGNVRFNTTPENCPVLAVAMRRL